MNPIVRTSVIGTIESRERKKIKINGDDKNIAEFRIEGLGLKLNAWGDLAVKVPEPGGTVVIEGALKTRNYQVDGKDRHTTEITVSTIEVLAFPASGPKSDAFDDGGDLPF